MQGDQWKSELSRLLALEQKKSVAGVGSAARVKQPVQRLIASTATVQSKAAIPTTASPRVAAATIATSQGFPGGASVAKTLIRLASPSPAAAFGLGSIVSSIVGLFTRDTRAAAPAATVFAMPSPIAYQGAVSGQRGAASGVRTTAGGTPERVSGQASNSAPVSVTVNAIDSKSFLDHSDAIASAVQKAMLESHSLNSVVRDL